MKNNYDKWFYDQYKYLSGNRKGKISFNDTKWIDLISRYKSLMDLQSSLPQQQPFGVMGNEYAFDQLIQLLSRSNYTFEDLNESLINTYKYSLKNCMGYNNVNTHVVIFKTKNTDRKNVTSNGEYYIVDVPFDQMSFGGRDEFIRQKIHYIHTTENGRYIPFNEFISNDLDDILGFSFLCTVNGFICNDCQVAIDDKGFKFKIKWLYSTDVEFIIYKLDTCFVHDVVVDAQQISSQQIMISQLNDLINEHGYGEYQCILNIYDENFKSSVPTVINFGTLNKQGLSIVNLQNKTLDMIERNKSESVHVVIYVLKYFHEVPNLYPAINYYELIESGKVYTDKHDDVVDVDGNEIKSSASQYRNNLEVCTPPISLDRSSTVSFKIVQSCLRMDSDLLVLNNKITSIGSTLSQPLTGSTVMSGVINPLTDLIPKLKDLYITYNEGCMLTSLVPFKYVKEFGTFVNNLQLALNTANEVIEQENPDYLEITKYDIPQLYGDNFVRFVNKICTPFKNKKLNTISQMKSLPANFFITNNSTRFNRPVSPYCFMVLKYDQNEDCWLLDNPTIKHFHGISNTFYIDSNLSGKEIFKFFVFYTDTQNPSEKSIEPLTEETIIDFDAFVTEVDKHIGFVKYWNIENKLLKYSKILYDKYDQDTCIQVLSKLLKHKLVDDEILYDYPSEIEYELSAINQFSYKEYDDNSEYAPFALNYLFYTLNMMNYDSDKLQSYFVHRLTDRRYNNRFIDVSLSKLISDDNSSLINLSHFSQYPTSIDTSSCMLPTDTYNAFYGYGNIVSNNGTSVESNPYPYVYNIYNTDIKYSLINEEGQINDEYYITYQDGTLLSDYGYIDYAYNVDITLAKYMSKYITALYAYISEFQTDYTSAFNKTWLCNIAIETIETQINSFNSYLNDHTPVLPSTMTTLNSIVENNEFIEIMNSLKELYRQCIYIQYQGTSISIYAIINDLLKDLRYTYCMFGFDNYAMKPIRALYTHLKKINSVMNVYEFKRWLSGINYNLLINLKYMMAKNIYSDVSQNTFDRYAQMIAIYIQQCHTLFDQITDIIDSLSTTFQTNHIDPIISYCLNTLETCAFDMYCISDIEVTSTTQYSSRPYSVIVSVDTSDSHFKIPNSSSSSTNNLILIPISEMVNDSYVITSMVGVCKYCVFDDIPLTSMTGVVKSKDGNQIGSVTFNISFTKTSNSSSISNDIHILNDLSNTNLDFIHTHETFEINQDDLIVNDVHAPVNYELYAGNHFKPLSSYHELINKEHSPIDRIQLPNNEINKLILQTTANNGSYCVYFKPSQVLHLQKDSDGVITSIGGKYKPGQRLYLYTKDLNFVFPVTVTTIDSNEARGFVECIVDSYNSKWFKVTDHSDITNYFTNVIECGVVDDNISSFMDEFNDTTNIEYNIIDLTNPPDVDEYILPGDPVFVTNNAPYIYTRLNYMFNETIPDRFYDESHELYSFTLIGRHNLYGENNEISINLISHNFQPFTENELYPELRSEPNDHEVYKEEYKVFNECLNEQNANIETYTHQSDEYLNEMRNATTEIGYQEALLKYEDSLYKLYYSKDFASMLDYMIKQPESATKWYNVRSYNAASVYINNGRAQLNSTYIPNISFIQSVDDINVYVYDWDNKYWINPEYYTINTEKVDNVNFGNKSNYLTNSSAYKMDITFDSSLPRSKCLLIYIGYNKSDLFDDIPIHDKTCYVRFKPLISTNTTNNNPYDDIKIRKHFDGCERYVFDEPNTPDDFSDGDCYKITRYDRNGKYQYAPSLRMCDLTVTNNNTDYPYTDFDLYIPNPFKDVSIDNTFKSTEYQATIIQPIDDSEVGANIKLICVSNNASSSYNGLLSSIMFEGLITDDGINIIESSVGYISEGHYICTVIPSSGSACVGGLVDVEVAYTETDVVDYSGAWIKITSDMLVYREIPHEFIIKPKNSFDYTSNTKITFNTKYIKYTDDTINETNDDSIYNPFEYYHDTKNDIRLPISDTRHNNHDRRFVVDTTLNTDVKVIKTTYVSVCRYSLNTIPPDGVIDVTGYIPTPLSRKRYEFYVNGRIVGASNVIILSPTSFQLINLMSLKNFELIELVDDVYNSSTFMKNNVYVSNTGKMFSSYDRMLLSDEEVIDQDIRFVFNTDQQSSIYKYNINTKPNNKNVEPDILMNLTYDDSTPMPYKDLYNLPTINGIQLMHLTSKDFGLKEISNKTVLDMFNKTWKREILTNPDFPTNHYVTNTKTTLHATNPSNIFPDIEHPNDWICVYASGNMNRYFTMYISNTSDGVIDDVSNTLKIIPFIKTGMYVLISSDYKDKWLHITTTSKSTIPTQPIQL